MRTIGLIFKDKPSVFICPFCDKEYKTEEGLENHIETKHAGETLEPETEDEEEGGSE